MRKIIEIFGGHPKVSGYTLYPENGKYEVNIDGDDDPKELGFPTEIDGVLVEYTHHKIHLASQWWESLKFTELENRTRVLDDPSIPVQNPTIATDSNHLALRVTQETIYGGCEIFDMYAPGNRGFTLSGIVWDRTTHAPLFLSCAHGLYRHHWSSSNFWPPEDIGTPIYQVRKPRKIGELLRCGVDTDAAVATIDSGINYDSEFFGPLGIKSNFQAIDVVVGDSIQRVGRTTGLQTGTVHSLNYNFQPSGYPPVLTHRISGSPQLVSGDSGSPIFRVSDGNIAGIGIGYASSYSYMVPATAIEADLNISFSPLPSLADYWSPTDEYTFTIGTSGTHRDWEDTATDIDEFTFTIKLPEAFSNEQVQEDIFDLVYVIHDTQNQTDTFKNYRGDLWLLYNSIKNSVNYWGPRQVPPANPEHDLNEDGWVTTTDVMLAMNWYLYGILPKTIKTTDEWGIDYYNWPSTPRSWQDTQIQTQSYVPQIQYIGSANIQIQTDLWYNPGDVTATQINTQTQADFFNAYSDQQQWHDNQIHYDTYDPSFPAKVRSWSDIQYQITRWDTTNLADIWQQIDQFQQGVTRLTLSQQWTQSDVFKPPHPVTITQTWVPTEVWFTPIISETLLQHWLQNDNFNSRSHAAGFNDNHVQTDLFYTLTQTYSFNDIQDQIDSLRTLTHSVSIEQMPYNLEETVGFTYVTGMVDFFDCQIPDPEREFNQTMNWFERWSTVLPTEDLTDIQTQTDNFIFNPIWYDLQDTQDHQETWHQLSGYFLDDIFYQTGIFTREHHAHLPWASTWTQAASFNVSHTPICILPTGKFTLIDAIESLELRNAEWGNTAKTELQRSVGITRSGTPFVARRPYWPIREVFHYKIKPLNEDRLDQILDFLERNIGKLIWWVDHYGVRHRGFCQEPATPAIRRARRRSEIDLTLVDVGDPHCDIIEQINWFEQWQRVLPTEELQATQEQVTGFTWQ